VPALPNRAHAEIDQRKLRDYVLNPQHPEGRHKARVFRSALGLTALDSEWLAAAIFGSVQEAEAEITNVSRWGSLYRVDVDLVRGNRCAKVRTGWLCVERSTKLTTCFIVGECDENS
jgi:hypothetical protein